MTPAQFSPGQKVRITNQTPPVHHRVPAYAKGKTGTVERVCGMHGTPEKFIRGDGQPAHRLYRIRIPQTSLWTQYEGAGQDVLDIEIFEHWLEAAE